MAKRKKSKDSSKGVSFSVELTGLILILTGIIGMGFGPIGKYIKMFTLFLAGEYWYVILFGILILGTYMLLNRKMPNFFTKRKIGCYLIILIILGFAHYSFLDNNDGVSEVFRTTYDLYMERVDTLEATGSIFESGDTSLTIGGGAIGTIVSAGLYSLFGKTGTTVSLIITLVFAIILALDITFVDLIKAIIRFFKKIPKDAEEIKKEFIVEGDELVGVKNEKNDEVVPIKDSRIVIQSIDDIKNVNKTEDIKEEPIPEVIEENIGACSSEYILPTTKLLKDIPVNNRNNDLGYLKAQQETLERVLNEFEIKAKVVDIHVGPAVTEYEITIQSGTKVNRIVNLNKEIALAMAAYDVRIQAPIPGKNTIGIEIPNREIASVGLKEVFEATKNQKGENKILIALGKDISGKSIITDLTKSPHLLVAGSTGSGKSVCINTIITSILMRYKPDEVKFVLVDPKKVELSNYNGIPSLYYQVVTDPKQASVALQKLVKIMESRYEIFEREGVRNIAGYNEKIEKENRKNPDKKTDKMYYIVAIIDELADLMLVASREVQDSIMRITQMARAAGIHLIVATQRPSTDIITGVIKNNIPSRISFAVSSSIDSRTILDGSGAEKLLGKGDMLFLPMGDSAPTRIQGCFISDGEIEKIIDHCKKQGKANYDSSFISDADIHSSSSGSSNSEGDDDPLYEEAKNFAIETGKVSSSLLQRRFRVGYNRAARIVDLLESRGIIGPQNGSKPREVLVKNDNSNDN